jgi:hypothetical protein
MHHESLQIAVSTLSVQQKLLKEIEILEVEIFAAQNGIHDAVGHSRNTGGHLR